jgi:hypothetical protein
MWNDACNGSYLRDQQPRLFSFANIEMYISFWQIALHRHTSIYHYPSRHWRNYKVEQIQQQSHEKERWQFCCENGNYSSRMYYLLSFRTITPPTPFNWIWKAKVTKKLKIFMWLNFNERLNSRNLHRRRNYKIDGDNYSSVLCNID